MVRLTTLMLLVNSSALPVLALPAKTFSQKRTVASLDQQAFEEANQRDETARRALSAVPIKTSNGRCLFVDELSGDFRANLIPVQVAACDGTEGQQWDVITAGKHNNQEGAMLVVNTLTNGCLTLDPSRDAGSQVMLFSCGGGADGGGQVTDSQLFPFDGIAGPLRLQPQNEADACLTVAEGSVLDRSACNKNDANQVFAFGGSSNVPVTGNSTASGSSPCTP